MGECKGDGEIGEGERGWRRREDGKEMYAWRVEGERGERRRKECQEWNGMQGMWRGRRRGVEYKRGGCREDAERMERWCIQDIGGEAEDERAADRRWRARTKIVARIHS